jgi:acyl-coenzyme A thioesterase PaaI-like protein
MSEVVVARQFCGPPNSGNGGYVAGLMAQSIPGPATAVLRAIIPLDTPLDLVAGATVSTLTGEAGALIGEATAASADLLPTPPAPPTLEQAEAAGKRYFALSRPFHPICFTCGPKREEGDGARVFVGPIAGAPAGHVAGVWRAAPGFCDAEGLARPEIVWAALDCPGSIAWVERLGQGGGLLGTMTAEILRRPAANEPVIITAWPLEQDGRKQFAGVAMFSAEGELMARAHQVWISMRPRAAA